MVQASNVMRSLALFPLPLSSSIVPEPVVVVFRFPPNRFSIVKWWLTWSQTPAARSGYKRKNPAQKTANANKQLILWQIPITQCAFISGLRLLFSLSLSLSLIHSHSFSHKQTRIRRIYPSTFHSTTHIPNITRSVRLYWLFASESFPFVVTHTLFFAGFNLWVNSEHLQRIKYRIFHTDYLLQFGTQRSQPSSLKSIRIEWTRNGWDETEKKDCLA